MPSQQTKCLNEIWAAVSGNLSSCQMTCRRILLKAKVHLWHSSGGFGRSNCSGNKPFRGDKWALSVMWRCTSTPQDSFHQSQLILTPDNVQHLLDRETRRWEVFYHFWFDLLLFFFFFAVLYFCLFFFYVRTKFLKKKKKTKRLSCMDSYLFFECHTVCTRSRCQLPCVPGCRFRGGAGKAAWKVKSGQRHQGPDWLTICLWNQADVWVHWATSSLLPGALARPFVCLLKICKCALVSRFLHV